MINYDLEFDKVKNAPLNEKMSAFKKFCKLIIDEKNKGSIGLANAAYEVCEVAGFALSPEMDDNPIIQQIMDISCDLEMYPDYSQLTPEHWDRLVELVERLPD